MQNLDLSWFQCCNIFNKINGCLESEVDGKSSRKEKKKKKGKTQQVLINIFENNCIFVSAENSDKKARVNQTSIQLTI